jgi:hypothetical protein
MKGRPGTGAPPALSPPATYTRPSGSSVAVWCMRCSPEGSGGAGLQLLLRGSYSALFTVAASPLSMPATTSTRPLGSNVAVWWRAPRPGIWPALLQVRLAGS